MSKYGSRNEKHKKIYEIINIRTTLICLIATIGTLMGAYGTIITFMGDHVQWLIDIHIAYKIIFIILISATITLLKKMILRMPVMNRMMQVQFTADAIIHAGAL